MMECSNDMIYRYTGVSVSGTDFGFLLLNLNCVAIKIMLTSVLILNTCFLVAQPEFQQRENTLSEYVFSLSYDLKLVQLSGRETPFSFRLWQPGQVIEVRRDSLSVLKGRIINFVRDYDESSLGRRDYFTRINTLKPEVITEAFKIISDAKTTLLHDPDESNKAVDPADIWGIIEICNMGKYSVSSLQAPGQPAYASDQPVWKLVRDLNQILSTQKIFNTFAKKIPYPCYMVFPREVKCK